jgi:hypothetical protein
MLLGKNIPGAQIRSCSPGWFLSSKNADRSRQDVFESVLIATRCLPRGKRDGTDKSSFGMPDEVLP